MGKTHAAVSWQTAGSCSGSRSLLAKNGILRTRNCPEMNKLVQRGPLRNDTLPTPAGHANPLLGAIEKSQIRPLVFSRNQVQCKGAMQFSRIDVSGTPQRSHAMHLQCVREQAESQDSHVSFIPISARGVGRRGGISCARRVG